MLEAAEKMSEYAQGAQESDFLPGALEYDASLTQLMVLAEDAWSSLHSDLSLPFPAPETDHIAVKVINHLGDEVMKCSASPISPEQQTPPITLA